MATGSGQGTPAVSPPASGNYITSSDVDNWAEGATTAEKLAAIQQVEALIERLTRDVFYAKTHVVVLDGNGKSRIFLGLSPDIIAVSEIVVFDDVLDSDYYTNDENSVFSDPAVGATEILDDDVVFTKGVNNVTVTCTAGWSTCPDAIKQAAIILVRADNDTTLYNRYSMNESESVDGFSFKRGKFLTGIHEADRLIFSYIRKKVIFGAA